MRNRTPTRVLENGAIRYAVYDEAGNFLRHDYLLPADDPADEGTALIKENLLSDSTEILLFGDAADRTINGAFRGLGAQLKLIQANVANITLTVQTANGTPISDVLVGGIVAEDGSAVYTNASGVAAGLIAEGDTQLSISGYADIANYSEILPVNKGTAITHTITVDTVNFMALTSSKSVKFSSNVETVDVSCGGGGGGGGDAEADLWEGLSCGGGGGGNVATTTGIRVNANESYAAVVGAGGAVNSDGGASRFLGVYAAGGRCGTRTSGGSGNGNGGAGSTKGSAGTQSIFESFTETTLYGGGGGGAGASGGSPGGGTGAMSRQSATAGKDGLGGGGGGGYDDYIDADSHDYASAAKGGSGRVTFRMHLKSA